jgi:hypothetical protein
MPPPIPAVLLLTVLLFRVTVPPQLRMPTAASAVLLLTVLLFRIMVLLAHIPNQQALVTPGARVCVAGVVQEYAGMLEIVPALPYDVELLQ